MIQSPADHIALANAAEAERDASFDRCDTDGFVSQAASGMMAQLHRKNAEIAECGGVWLFRKLILTDLNGNDVGARLVQTKFGQRWRVDESDEWLPVAPKRASTLGKRGFIESERIEVAPAKAVHWAPSGARGFSGLGSVQTIIVRIDGKKGWHAAGRPNPDQAA